LQEFSLSGVRGNPFLDSSLVGHFDIYEDNDWDNLHISLCGVALSFFNGVIDHVKTKGGSASVDELDSRFRNLPRFPGLIQLALNGAVARTAYTGAIVATIIQVHYLIMLLSKRNRMHTNIKIKNILGPSHSSCRFS
jgi:hypothetical protein